MSNKSEPHHKFVQTFVLATQPNGYFVLNDICRYLSEDVDEIVEDEPVQGEPVVEQKEEPVAEPAAVPEPTAVEEETVTADEAVEQVDDKLEATLEEPQAEPEAVNGKEEAQEEEEQADEQEAADITTSEIVESEPAPADIAPKKTEEPYAPEPTPVQTSPQQAPTDDGPPVKKTWAAMVGNTKAAIPALPQAAAPAAAAASTAQPKPQRPVATTTAPKAAPTEPAADAPSGTPTSQQSNGWQEAGKKTRNQQPKAQDGVVHAYIKNVNDKIDARVLREVLEKYGTLKYYDVSRPKVRDLILFEVCH